MWLSQPNRDSGAANPGCRRLSGGAPAESRRQVRLPAPLLIILTVVTLLAQNSSEDVRRVGSRLQCKCGCPHTVASCDMFECEFSKPAKLRIAQMKEQGVSDQAVVDEYIQKYGQE